MAGEVIRVVVVDDHDLVREGVRSVLAREDGIELVGEAAELDAAVETITRARPDLVLLDVSLGPGSGIDVARAVRARDLDCRILVLSVRDSPEDLRAALAAGADGYVLKTASAPAVVDAIRRAAAGETVIGEEFVPKLLEDAARTGRPERADVTAREREVLELVAAGCKNREIAERLAISTRTVHKHLENLFRKLGANDRAQLVTEAFRRSLLR